MNAYVHLNRYQYVEKGLSDELLVTLSTLEWIDLWYETGWPFLSSRFTLNKHRWTTTIFCMNADVRLDEARCVGIENPDQLPVTVSTLKWIDLWYKVG